MNTFSLYNNRKNTKIIDVQDRYEYDISHIPGSINIPYDHLVNNYREYLIKGTTYYLYCKSGKLSKRASIILNYLGYNTYVLENNIN